jgi:5,8-dihydroxy-2-naphthoate synthase
MPGTIQIAHSPDADDAFMHYALFAGKIPCEPLAFEEVLADIETLNRRARDGTYEVTAVSFHAFAYLDDRYALLNSGGSMGDGYGPVVVAQRALRREALAGKLVATPGRLTSARLAMQLWQPEARCIDVPFDAVMDAVRKGEVMAGVIIHEGQLTYAAQGLEKVVDLGEWWAGTTGSPLPLGGNVVRRNLGHELTIRVAGILESSIRYALDHREEALAHALSFGRGLDAASGDRFVGMYVNAATLDYGDRGRQAIELFYESAFAEGLIPNVPRLDFVRGEARS